MKKNLLLIACLFFIYSSYAQTDYYVDGTNGNDDNDGTTLVLAWQTLQTAFDNATEGSTVYIRGGVYHENVNVNVSGTPGSPIVFTNYEDEVVILDGTATPENDMLYMEDQSYITIENITIQNKTGNNATGVTVTCTPFGVVSNIVLRNLKISGIDWSSDHDALPTENDNSNPVLFYGTGNAQSNAISDIVIDGCEVFDNITGFSEAISIDGNVSNFVVSNNLVHDNTNIGIVMAGNYQVSANEELDHARNGFCFQNNCYNNVSAYATSAGIYVDGGMNILIEHNTSHDNGFGIELGCEEDGFTRDILVRNNLIYHNKEAGLAMGGYNENTTGIVLNCTVRNNTFLSNDWSHGGVGEVYLSKVSESAIRNNIFYSNEQNILMTKDNIAPFENNQINYNCWYTPANNSNEILVNWNQIIYSDWSQYVLETGMDSNSFYANPMLVNDDVTNPDVHLFVGSPCINGGDPAWMSEPNETDFYHAVRMVDVMDIGASEFQLENEIMENGKETGVFIFPNPVINEARVVLSEKCTDAHVFIYNTQGQIVRQMSNVNGQTILLNLGDLQGGIYFLRVCNLNRFDFTEKLILE